MYFICLFLICPIHLIVWYRQLKLEQAAAAREATRAQASTQADLTRMMDVLAAERAALQAEKVAHEKTASELRQRQAQGVRGFFISQTAVFWGLPHCAFLPAYSHDYLFTILLVNECLLFQNRTVHHYHHVLFCVSIIFHIAPAFLCVSVFLPLVAGVCASR